MVVTATITTTTPPRCPPLTPHRGRQPPNHLPAVLVGVTVVVVALGLESAFKILPVHDYIEKK